MSGLIGAIIAAVIGAVLAFGGSTALISSQAPSSEPIDAPLVTYGSRS